MNELPTSWIEATVGELFETAGGGTPSTTVPEYWRGTIPWISSADIDDMHHMSISRFISENAIRDSATNLVPAGSVIVVTRVGLGKVSVAEGPLCFSQDHQALLIDPKHFDTKYVLYFMSQAVKSFKQISRGTTISGVTKKQLLETNFTLPPRPEQTRIVAEIEKQFTRLDAATAALKRVQANLKRYRASVLKAACEGRLVPTEAELARKEGRDYEPADKLLQRILRERRARWEADTLAKMQASGKPPTDDSWKQKYKEPSAPDTSNLPELPKGWCWTTVEQVGFVQLGRQRAPQHHQGKNMRPYLRVANVFEDRIDTADMKTMNFTPAEFVQYKLEVGDILLNEGQSFELVGRPAMFRGEVDNCCFQKTLLRFRPSNLIEGDFALTVFLTYLNNGTFQKVTRRTTTMAHLTAERFLTMAFPLPPIEEQRRVVRLAHEALSRMSRLQLELVQAHEKGASLRRSTLAGAFSGTLVPQDPTDEPASVLLERIRAGRGSQDNQKPSGRARRAAASKEKS
jgi:type I restriction enzyme S subunit